METYIENIDNVFKQTKNKFTSKIKAPLQSHHNGEYIFNDKIIERPSYMNKHKYDKLTSEKKKLLSTLHTYEYNKARDFYVDEIDINNINLKLEHINKLIEKYKKNNDTINDDLLNLYTEYEKNIEKNRNIYFDKLTNVDEIKDYLSDKKKIEELHSKIIDKKEKINKTIILNESDVIIIPTNQTTTLSTVNLLDIKDIISNIKMNEQINKSHENNKIKKKKNDKNKKGGNSFHTSNLKKTLKKSHDSKSHHTQNLKSILRKNSMKNSKNISWKKYCENGTPIIDNSQTDLELFEGGTSIDMDLITDTFQEGGDEYYENETSNETLNETSNENQMPIEIPKQTLNQTSNETSNETLNEMPKQTLNETSNETLNETSNETLNETSNEMPKQTLNETSNEIQMNGGNINNLDVDNSIIEPQIKRDVAEMSQENNMLFNDKKNNYDYKTMYAHGDVDNTNDVISNSNSGGLLSENLLTKKLNEGHSDNLTINVLGDNNKNYSTPPYSHLKGNNDNEKLLQLKELKGGNAKKQELITPVIQKPINRQVPVSVQQKREINKNFNEITINTSNNIPKSNTNTQISIQKQDIPSYNSSDVKVISIK